MKNNDLTRIPPQALDSEVATLGSMLIDEEAVAIVMNILAEDAFYLDSNKVIFRAIKELHSSGEPIDQLTLTEKLGKMKLLDSAGGVVGIANLVNRVPSTANVENYAKNVKSAWSLRMMLKETYAIQDSIFEDDDSGNNGSNIIIDTAITRLIESRTAVENKKLQKLNIQSSMRYIDMLSKDPKSAGVVMTHIDAFDNQTNGLRPGELIVIAGRPGMWKTTVALNIAMNIALDNNPVAFFSLEMMEQELAVRVVSSMSGVPYNILSNGKAGAHHYAMIKDVYQKIQNLQLFIDDTSGLNPINILTRARLMKQKYGLKAIMVDYLQIMSPPGSKYGTRNEEVSAISGGLKSVAKQLNVPVIAFAQLSRAPELRQNHRPILSDLRDSGSLEQDADLCAFLYRDGYYNHSSDPHELEVNFAKFRRGATGMEKTRFEYETMRVLNIDKIHKEDDFEPFEDDKEWGGY